MKTFRILGMALVAVMLGFAMSACSDDDNDYLKELEKEYARLIVGKWFCFTSEMNMLVEYKTDGSFSQKSYNYNIITNLIRTESLRFRTGIKVITTTINNSNNIITII